MKIKNSTWVAFLLPSRIVFYITLVAVLLTSGCLTIETARLYNHTGQQLAVVVAFPGTNITALVGNGDYVEIGSPSVEIHHGADIWRYDRRLFIEKRRFETKIDHFEILVKLQIEPKGAIYVMRPDSSGTTTNLPAQPRGFPLQPIRSGVSSEN